MGPFTTAANLAGTTTVLKAMRKDPEGLYKLLDFAADATIEVGRKFVENQIGIGLAETTPSPRDAISRYRLHSKISMPICVQQDNVQNIRYSRQTGNKYMAIGCRSFEVLK